MAQPFTFIHAADLHLDTPFSGVERGLGAELAGKLRDATLETFDRLVELCIARDAAFLLIAGDLCDGPERGVRAQSRLERGLKKLHNAGVETFIVAGNHDPLTSRDGGWGGLARWPESVHFFKATPQSFEVSRNGETLAVVHGVSYPKREPDADLAAKLKRSDVDAYQIGLVHATIGNPELVSAHKNYAPTTFETLEDSGLDYWALGHVHTRAILREASPAVVYPGNPQALSSRETGPRGAYVVEVDGGREASLEFAPLDSVRFARLELEIGGLESLTGLVEKMQETLDEAREQSEGRACVVKLTITGSGPLYSELAQNGAVEELTRTVRETDGIGEGAEPATWLSRVINATKPQLDLEALKGQEGLPSALLETVEALEKDRAALKAFSDEAWAELLTPRTRKYLDTEALEEELLEELTEARDLALSQLASGEHER